MKRVLFACPMSGGTMAAKWEKMSREIRENPETLFHYNFSSCYNSSVLYGE